jgi:NADPH-dependent 2,4-dienoyl-CoA reductase/sulfur reductase-like enzyme
VTALTAGDRIVVAGAGVAAARTVQQLRRQGHRGPVTMLAEERRAPYDRPPLSKAVLHGRRDDTSLRFDAAALDVDLRLGQPAHRLDVARRIVIAGGQEIPFDRLVIATGAEPVRLAGDGPQVTLRTLDDALALRGRLAPAARVVIVGAGWIGAEVATAALARGCRVTCLEAAAAPLAQPLGAEIGASFLAWWRDADLRLGVTVAAVRPGRVDLTDGGAVAADVVVAGVGVRPATGWLAGSGIDLDRGVLVDEHLQTSVPGIVALGDCAARWSPRSRARLRVEHWTDAGSAGLTAAGTLLAQAPGSAPVHDPVPYFWSDQFGHKLQFVGHRDPADRPVERDTGDTPGRTVSWVDRAGRITAVLTVDRPAESAAAHQLVAAGAIAADELLAQMFWPEPCAAKSEEHHGTSDR